MAISQHLAKARKAFCDTEYFVPLFKYVKLNGCNKWLTEKVFNNTVYLLKRPKLSHPDVYLKTSEHRKKETMSKYKM